MEKLNDLTKGWHPKWAMMDAVKIPFEQAKINAFSVGVSYAVTAFECIRAHRASDGSLHIFRLDDHLNRLNNTMRLMKFANPPSFEELKNGVIDTVKINAVENQGSYIRLHVYLSPCDLMLSNGPSSWICAAAPRARSPLYYHGARATISSWMRASNASVPSRIKATANYHVARLAAIEAKENGYDATILLNDKNEITECPGSNIFFVKKNKLITPNLDSNILEGITRDTIITLAKNILNLSIEERSINVNELCDFDEAFHCGTGPEIIPILSIDNISMNGIGEYTKLIQNTYDDMIQECYTQDWLTEIDLTVYPDSESRGDWGYIT
jgi:branched-chain amino acid aminotransferase